MTKILDGKALSIELKKEIAIEVSELKKESGVVPRLAAILVGSDGASETYIAGKIKSCDEVGIISSLFRFDSDVSMANLLKKIDEINSDSSIHGLIVQLPLPAHISQDVINEAISPEKDVDGFHPINSGKMAAGLECYLPATPFGILMLLERYKIDTVGKHCVVLGRSHIVGQPISVLLSRNAYPGNCTVTLCHSRTVGLIDHLKRADIIIAALGKPHFVNAGMIKEGVVIVDVGITRVQSSETKSGYRIQGDVDFDSVLPHCSYITPVPGGVGPLTIVGLMKNTLLSAKRTRHTK